MKTHPANITTLVMVLGGLFSLILQDGGWGLVVGFILSPFIGILLGDFNAHT